MTSTVYKVSDASGNPLPGVKVTQVSDPKNYGCGSQTNVGFTGSDGIANIDTGCWAGTTGTYTAEAPGYQTVRGKWSSGLFGNPNTQVTMSALASSFGGLCLPGFIHDPVSDQCIQQSSANWFTIIGGTVKDNWLLIVVLLVVVAVVAAMLWKPGSFTSAAAAVGAVGGAASG